MITCKQVTDRASDYVDTPPGLMSRISLRIHLIMCKHCRRYLHQLRISSRASAEIGKPEPPGDDEIDRLVERLKSD